jgi:hypothetical protein
MAQWFYEQHGQRNGPVDTATLKRMAIDGQLDPNDLIWREGLAQWVRASTAKGLYPQPVESPDDDFTIMPATPVAVARSVPPPPPSYDFQVLPHNAAPQQSVVIAQTLIHAPAETSHRGMAIAALVLSICGLFCFGFITGLLAVIFAAVALSGMGKTRNDDGKGMAITGLVLGIIDIIGWLIWLAVVFG